MSLFPELLGYLPIFPHSEHLIIFVSTLLYLRNSTAFLHIRHLSLSSSSSSVCKERKHIQTAMLHTSLGIIQSSTLPPPSYNPSQLTGHQNQSSTSLTIPSQFVRHSLVRSQHKQTFSTDCPFNSSC